MEHPVVIKSFTFSSSFGWFHFLVNLMLCWTFRASLSSEWYRWGVGAPCYAIVPDLHKIQHSNKLIVKSGASHRSKALVWRIWRQSTIHLQKRGQTVLIVMVWLAALRRLNPASFSSDMFSERWKKDSISSLQKRHVWRKQLCVIHQTKWCTWSPTTRLPWLSIRNMMEHLKEISPRGSNISPPAWWSH